MESKTFNKVATGVVVAMTAALSAAWFLVLANAVAVGYTVGLKDKSDV